MHERYYAAYTDNPASPQLVLHGGGSYIYGDMAELV